MELCEEVSHHFPTCTFTLTSQPFRFFTLQLPHHSCFRQLKIPPHTRQRTKPSPVTNPLTRILVISVPSRANAPTSHSPTPYPLHSSHHLPTMHSPPPPPQDPSPAPVKDSSPASPAPGAKTLLYSMVLQISCYEASAVACCR